MRTRLLLLVMVLFAVGCQRDLLRPEDLKVVASPGVVVPLGRLSLNLQDVVPVDTSSKFEVGTTPYYTISYHEDSLMGISVDDLFTLPAQPPFSLSNKLGNLFLPDINSSSSITLGALSSSITNPSSFASSIQNAHGSNAPFPSLPIQNPGNLAVISLGAIQSADFSSGDLSMKLVNGFPAPVSVSIALANSQGIELVTFSFINVSPNDSAVSVQNLSGLSLPGNLDVRLKNLSSPGAGTPGLPSTYVPIDTADALELTLLGTSLVVHSATAITTTQTVADTTHWTSFSVPNGIEVTNIGVLTGHLDYNVISAFPEPVVVNLSLPGSQTSWGAEWAQTLTIVPNTLTTGNFSLNDLSLDLSQQQGLPFNSLPLSYEILLLSSGQPVVVDSSQSVSFNFGLNNLVMDYVYGFFGTDSFALPADTSEIDLPFLDKLTGSIVFTEPSLTLSFSNQTNLGIPITLDLDVSAIKKDGTSVALTGPVSTVLNHPVLTSQMGQNTSVDVSFSPNNSNLGDVLAWPKKAITYGGKVSYNKDTLTTGRFNYISRTSKMKVGADFTLPVALRIHDLKYVDSLEVSNLKEQLERDTSVAISAKLHVHSESFIPLDAELNLRFYSEIGQLVWVETVPLLHSAYINPSTGLVSQPTITVDVLTLDDVGIEQIALAKWMQIEALLETAGGGQDPVKLDPFNGLNLYFELEIELEKQLL